MQIESISLKHFEAPLKHPFVTALRRVDTLHSRVVEITIAEGFTGYGEVAPTAQITGETIESIESSARILSNTLCNRRFASLQEACDTIHHSLRGHAPVKAAFVNALYDIEAKRKNLPLYRMLGGVRSDFETDLTISLGKADETLQAVEEALQRGYRYLKIKLGRESDFEAHRILTLHRRFGKHIHMRLDANQAWSATETIRFLSYIESHGIAAQCIEQPVKADDIDALARIKHACRTPLLADESVFSHEDAKRLFKNDTVDMINIKLAKTGGIDEALRLGNLCRTYDKKCMIGCMLEGPIAVAAALHLTSALGDTVAMIDLDAPALLASYELDCDVTFDESHLKLASSSGLGIRL